MFFYPSRAAIIARQLQVNFAIKKSQFIILISPLKIFQLLPLLPAFCHGKAGGLGGWWGAGEPTSAEHRKLMGLPPVTTATVYSYFSPFHVSAITVFLFVGCFRVSLSFVSKKNFNKDLVSP